MQKTLNRIRLTCTILAPKMARYYTVSMALYLSMLFLSTPAFAINDIFAVAQEIIVDVYNGIAGISTALAGLMSAVAVIGAKMSSNQHNAD